MATLYLSKADVIFTTLGNIRAGGKVYFYLTGTATPLDTFSDAGLTTANLNPITLSAAGRPEVDVFLGHAIYKVIYTNADGTDSITVPTVNGVTGIISATFALVANIKAQASATLADGQLAQVRGYFTNEDGGGGLFRWSDASTATQDNVIVFRPDDTGAGVAGRWIRDLTGLTSLAVEMGGAKDDNASGSAAANATAIRAVIDAADANDIGIIDFLGRDTKTYYVGKIIDATSMPEGLHFRGIGQWGGNVWYPRGVVLRYEGTEAMWDIRHSNGTDEIGSWKWEGLNFAVGANLAGSAFWLNYYRTAAQGGADYTPTFDNTTPSYMGHLKFERCGFWGAGPNALATGHGIRAKKVFYLSIDENCRFTGWQRAVFLNGCDNNTIAGQFTGNGRHIDLRYNNTFGNNNELTPGFLGELVESGENAYCVFDTAQYTSIPRTCLWETTAGRALMYISGAGTFLNAPAWTSASPCFESSGTQTNVMICGLASPRLAFAAPINGTPASWEGDLSAGGEPRVINIIGANALNRDRIGNHPTIKFVDYNPNAFNTRHISHPIDAYTNANGSVLRRQTIINSHFFPVEWSYSGGFSGNDSMTADAACPTGYCIRMLTGASRGWLATLIVGRHISNNDWVRGIVRHKNITALSSGSWRWAIGATNGALAASTTYTTTAFAFQLTGAANGDALMVGLYDSAANGTGLDVDSMIITVCEANIVTLTDSSGGTADDTIAALAVLTDSPASVDALRDNLMATWAVTIANNNADLAAKINALEVAMRRLNHLAG